MSVRIWYDSQNQIVKSGFVINGDVWKSYPSYDDLHYQEVNHDLMIELLTNGLFWVIPSKPRSLAEIFSLKGFEGSVTNLSVGAQPLNPDKGIGTQYEYNTYGNVTKGIQIFIGSIFGGNTNVPSSSTENTCSHETFSGELIAAQTQLQWVESFFLLYGNSIGVKKTNGHYWRWCFVDSPSPLRVHIDPRTRDECDYDLLDLVLRMKGQTFWDTVPWYESIFIRQLSNVDIQVSDTLATISYTMDVVSHIPYEQHYNWDAWIHIPLVCAPASVEPYPGGPYSVLYGDQVTFRYLTHIGEPFHGLLDRTFSSGDGDPFKVFPTALTGPIYPLVDESSTCHEIAATLSHYPPLELFKRSIAESWSHIVPSSAFSAVDAFKQAEGCLGVNVLQNIAKIPQYDKMIPQLTEAITILGKIARRDLSLSTIREILDLATSTTLQASFEWRPYHAIVTSYLPEIASTLQSLRDSKGCIIGRGSYSFKINNDLSRESVTLLTRTKIVMDGSPFKLLSAVLGIDALGLLPKASNLWDLIPFSFMANWFTGVGEAIRRAEYLSLLIAIPAYYVHTYTLTSPLSSSELATLGATSVGEDPCALRMFYRDVTLYNPIPRDSRFGFGMPSGFPPLGTFGSLLYQLFFS